MQAVDHLAFAPSARVRRSKHEWRRLLTAEQYRILREGGTERPFGWAYEQYLQEGDGIYRCAGCQAELFPASARLDSFGGWPAFYHVIDPGGVTRRHDVSHGPQRVAVACAQCGGHLGHVFEGEGFDTPTDLRYQVNRLALAFVPA